MPASTSKFKNLSRKARGSANLGGIVRVLLYAESDFTAGWPIATQVTATGVATAPPLKTDVLPAEIVFDLDSCRATSSKKGSVGYQSYNHGIEAKVAGVSAEQSDAVAKFLNEGGVAIAYYKDGTRRIYGASWNPLMIEDDDDSGAKAEDPNGFNLKASGAGYPFHAPFLASSVTLVVDATAVKPMPFLTA